MENRKSFRPLRFLFQVFQGAVIGLGAVLPGVSGGVLAVIFGVYRPIMELLSSPSAHYRTHLPRLLPVFLGYAAGFLGVARLLAFLLETWPDPSVCVFVGLITGMLPSLFREAAEQGRSRGSFVSLLLCMAVIFLILTGVDALSVEVTPNFFWYLFCGFCLALSVIAPGMSFSTLLMPLGLYTPLWTASDILTCRSSSPEPSARSLRSSVWQKQSAVCLTGTIPLPSTALSESSSPPR